MAVITDTRPMERGTFKAGKEKREIKMPVSSLWDLG